MSGVGIVHFGPGAFHRAHQADYIDRLLQHDARWGIAAVSLRSPGTVAALERQGGRYSLVTIDRETSFRTLAAHKAFYGPGEDAAVRRRLLDPAVRVVSSTVTEKGYCLAADGTLDFGHPDIVHDLAQPQQPASLVGWLALGLSDRRAAGLPPFTALCCDNMASNGRKLRGAVIAYAERLDRDLARWIGGEACFPDTMVDSITPATDDRLRDLVRSRTGFADAIPVSREPYAAWIIENRLPPEFPDLARVGVTIAADVATWEKAKLRMLNGAHSTLAYLGLLIGHETVADAMADAALARFVEGLIREEIIPSLAPSALDLDAYARDILARFRNPAIGHKLAQIAWDGSQKLPYRLLDTLGELRSVGREAPRLITAVAGWMAFVARQAQAASDIVDPLSPALTAAGRSGDPVEELLALQQIFPAALAADDDLRRSLDAAFRALRHSPREALSAGNIADHCQ